MRDDTISRAAAIDALHDYFDGMLETDTICPKDIYNSFEIIPSAQRLLEDGTLIVKVPNLSAVHRVIVDAENSQYCKTFYQDGDEDGV